MHLYVQYGYVLLSIVICIFYIIVLLTIYKHRKTEFKTEFFKIFAILGSIDCYRMLNWILVFILPRWGWLEWLLGGGCHDWPCIWFAGYATTSNSTLDKVSKTLNLVLAVNRFTCMAFWLTHKKIWKNRVVPIVVVAILVSMLANGGDYTVQILSGAIFSKFVTANKTIYALHMRDAMDPFIARIWGVWNSIYAYGITASFIFLHGVALYKACKHRHEVQPIEADPSGGETEGISDVEYKLVMAMSVLSLAQISSGIYIMSAGFFPEIFFADFDLFYQGWDLIVLGDCMSNPVLVFVMCSELREKVIQFVKCGP